MRKNMAFTKVISILCIISIVIGAFSVTVSASKNAENNNIFPLEHSDTIDYYDYLKYLDQSDCSFDADNLYVSFENEKTHFASNEQIEVSYYVYNCDGISSCTYSQNGFDGLSIAIDTEDNNRIVVKMSCSPNEKEYYISLQITTSNDEVVEARLYAITSDYGVFISPFSVDNAYYKYLRYMKEQGIITEQDYESLKAEYSRRGVRENIYVQKNNMNSRSVDSASTDTGVSIKAILRWDDGYGSVHSLRNTKVEIYNNNPNGLVLLTTTYTDNNGEITYNIETNGDNSSLSDFGSVFLKVYAGTDNVMVKNEYDESYFYETSSSDNFVIEPNSTIMIIADITMESDKGRAFQISQAMLTARDYAKEMMGTMPEDVVIRYPHVEIEKENKCFYRRSEKRIYITGAVATGGYPESYASWDVLMHEYGHHTQYQLGIINSPGGDHRFYENLVDEYDITKSEGIRLAWSEAWATIFGFMAQSYYSDDLYGVLTVGDSYYTAYNKWHYDLESTNDRLGEACEGSIAAVLWDLYDSVNETNDTISLGHTAYWAVTTGNQAKTFSQFIAYFYSVYPNYVDDIAKNLSYYKMASTKPTVFNTADVSTTVAPFFSWDKQGGSNDYPNNSFYLIFYEGNTQNEIMRTQTITVAETRTTENLDTAYYLLTEEEWDTLMRSRALNYSVAVATIQTDSPQTGEYISERSQIYNFPVETVTVTINCDNYIDLITVYEGTDSSGHLSVDINETTVTLSVMSGTYLYFETAGPMNVIYSDFWYEGYIVYVHKDGEIILWEK